MKTKVFYTLLVSAVLLVILPGCSSKVAAPVDRDSGLIYYSGKAKITAIVPSTESSERGMYHIYYDFTPLNASHPSQYKHPLTVDTNIKLYHDHRESFHINWINKWNIKVGNSYPALRSEQKNAAATGNNVHFEILLDSPQD